MQRLFSMVLAVTCVTTVLAVTSVVDSTPGFARGAGHGMGRGGGVGISRGAGVGIRGMGAGMGRTTGAGIGRGAGTRQMPAVENPIPGPLSSPAQAPIINGPLNSNGLPSMGGGE
jgi:hypothetical protein